eukprot:2879028-Lingulodinium_polyedra.AAC.1
MAEALSRGAEGARGARRGVHRAGGNGACRWLRGHARGAAGRGRSPGAQSLGKAGKGMPMGELHRTTDVNDTERTAGAFAGLPQLG